MIWILYFAGKLPAETAVRPTDIFSLPGENFRPPDWRQALKSKPVWSALINQQCWQRKSPSPMFSTWELQDWDCLFRLLYSLVSSSRTGWVIAFLFTWRFQLPWTAMNPKQWSWFCLDTNPHVSIGLPELAAERLFPWALKSSSAWDDGEGISTGCHVAPHGRFSVAFCAALLSTGEALGADKDVLGDWKTCIVSQKVSGQCCCRREATVLFLSLVWNNFHWDCWRSFLAESDLCIMLKRILCVMFCFPTLCLSFTQDNCQHVHEFFIWMKFWSSWGQNIEKNQ